MSNGPVKKALSSNSVFNLTGLSLAGTGWYRDHLWMVSLNALNLSLDAPL